MARNLGELSVDEARTFHYEATIPWLQKHDVAGSTGDYNIYSAFDNQYALALQQEHTPFESIVRLSDLHLMLRDAIFMIKTGESLDAIRPQLEWIDRNLGNVLRSHQIGGIPVPPDMASLIPSA